MCGRYYIDDEDPMIAEIIAEVEKKNSMAREEMKAGEIFPTNIVPVVTSEEPILAKWGFSRFDGKGQIINARSETAIEKPIFRKPLLEHRCLIPASHYFEWQKTGSQKQKTALRLPGKQPLYMAGFYRREKDVPYPVFVIMTREAGKSIAQSEWLSLEVDLDRVLSGAIDDGIVYQSANT